MATNAKTLFYTDLALIPLFVLTLLTGIRLHLAGHIGHHGTWHDWAVFHTVSSIVLLIGVAVHIKSHWKWYKSLRKSFRNKKKITLILSVLFAVVALTGGVLLFRESGANTQTGVFHYKVGIIAGLVGIGHLVKRFSILRTGLNKLRQ